MRWQCAKAWNQCHSLPWFWMDHNQSFQPNWLQMTCFVWKPCSDQHWQDKFWFICLVNNHLLYYWPNSHYSILKICPKFQVLSFQFSGVNELLDEHWAKIENISTAIYKMYQWKFLHSRILIYSVWLKKNCHSQSATWTTSLTENDHLLYFWPTVHNLFSKTCPEFEDFTPH